MHHPGALGEVGGHDTQRAEVVFAPLDHLLVVDPRQLRVDPPWRCRRARTIVVRSSDDPALDMGWPLRSVSPVSEALGTRPVKDRNALAGRNTERAHPCRPPAPVRPPSASPGEAAGQLVGVDDRGSTPLARAAWTASSAWMARNRRTSVATSAARSAKATAGVPGIELERGLGVVEPLSGPLRALLAVRHSWR